MKPSDDYPRMLFHRTKDPVTVHSREEEEELGAEWSRRIWPPAEEEPKSILSKVFARVAALEFQRQPADPEPDDEEEGDEEESEDSQPQPAADHPPARKPAKRTAKSSKKKR